MKNLSRKRNKRETRIRCKIASLNNFVWSFSWCWRRCCAWKRKERKSKKMVIDSPALASLVGGRAQKEMENERKRPKICKKQDNQIPRERKCKSKKDSLIQSKNSLFGYGRRKIQQKLAAECLNICIRRKRLILSLNLFLALNPKSLTGACSPFLNCFTIANGQKLVLVFKKDWLWNLILNCPLRSKN